MKAIIDINGLIYNALGFSDGLWLLTAAILFALLCFCFVLTVRKGRMKPRTFWMESLWLAVWYAVLYAMGFLFYSPTGAPLYALAHPRLDWCLIALMLISLFSWYFIRRKTHWSDLVSATAIRRSAAGSGASKYCYALLFASMLVSSVICGLRLGCGDSIVHLAVPMALVVLILLLYSLTGWRFWYLFGALLLIAYDFLWIQNLLAETDFAYTPLLAMIPLCLATILPMLSLGTMKK